MRRQTVADAGLSNEMRRPIRVCFDLPAQPADGDPQWLQARRFALAPDFSRQLTVGKDPSGMADENREDLVLEGGQRYWSAAYPHLAANEVGDEIARNEIRRLTLCLEAVPECRPRSRQQLSAREGLRHVIIRAEIEGPDLRALIIADREHDDRHQRLAPDDANELEPIPVGERRIQDDHLTVLHAHPFQRLGVSARFDDLISGAHKDFP